ncbi:ATP-binding protein [Photobacterium japonica]|uniref:ATP-binding protein n=1 Tax=Photobacterium japonica TaxID=2910235 RepID=UPI003D0EDE11
MNNNPIKQNTTKRYSLIFIGLSLILLPLSLYAYVQNVKLDTYLLRLTDLGHHLIHLRDDIILATNQGISQPYALTSELVIIEHEVETIKQHGARYAWLPDMVFHDELNTIVEDFSLFAIALTGQLDMLVGVSVAKSSTLLSLRVVLDEKNDVALDAQPSNALLADMVNQSLHDKKAEYYPFKRIFTELNAEQRRLYRLLLSEGSVGFVEASERKVGKMQAFYRDLNAFSIVSFLILLLFFIFLLTKARLRELQRINLEIAKGKDKAEAASRAKSVFLATMSHELRTPMNGVLGIADLIESETQEPETKDQVKVIIDSGQHLLTLLNDILDFSKIEEGKMTLEETEFSLDSVIIQLDTTLRPLACNKGLTFDLTNALPPHTNLYGDAARFRQILFNLIGNAIKFTEQGRVDVAFSYANVHLTVSVRDTGVGIPSDKLDTIFSPFEQAENSTTRRFGGTGLGLSIVKEITRLMQGTIHVTSEENVGSEFVVTLPFAIDLSADVPNVVISALDVSNPSTAKNENESQAAKCGLHILLVEDNAVNAMVARRYCEKAGHKVTHCLDALKAIETLKQTCFDLILMDNHMPEMQGSEAIKIIRQELHIQTVIFACTADVFQETHDAFMTSGAQCVLTKPLQACRLNDAIATFADQIERFGMLHAVTVKPAVPV